MRLDTTGVLYYVEPLPPAAPLEDIDEPAPGPFPDSQTFLLHSRPGADRTIFLDFDGHVVSNTAWRADDTGPYTALPFDSDLVVGFGSSEHDTIQSVWLRVAEDFAPFDVDVTTQDPGFDRINRVSAADQQFGTRVLITNSPATAFTGGSSTGVAYIGVFDSFGPTHASYQPALVFSSALRGEPKLIAEVVTHETGHNLGLAHDGRVSGETYYAGHAMWAPVMGVGYYRPVVQWSQGEYATANQLQDDISVIGAHSVAVRADDHTNVMATATPLTSTAQGVITPTAPGDADLFRYVAPASGTVTLSASPAAVSPNLDIMLRLFSAAGVLLAENNPPSAMVTEDVASGLGASIQYNVVGGATYYLEVGPTGIGTGATGYTTYGSLGQYSVTVSAPQAKCPADDVFEPNDTRAAARLVTSGQTVPGVVCAGNDDYFSIDVAPGARIDVDVWFPHAAGDLDVTLFNPDGSVNVTAASADDNEAFDVVATQAGVYALRVSGVGVASNTYQLTIQTTGSPPVCPDDVFEPNDTRAAAQPLTSGQTVPGVVCSGNEDFFSIDASAGTHIDVDVLFSNASGDLDVTLFNPDGSVNVSAESADDNEAFDVVATQAGVYALRVYGYAGASNTYQLTTTSTPPVTPPVTPPPVTPPVTPPPVTPPPVTPPPVTPPVTPGAGSTIVTVQPYRLYDSRTAGLVRPAGSVTEVQVTGRGGVPLGASMAALNVTAVAPAEAGFMTVFPCGGSVPEASNLNHGAGQTIANATVVKLDPTGRVCVFTYAPSGLLVDVNGYTPAISNVVALSPFRLYDSRSSAGPRPPGSVTVIQVAGVGGVPAGAAAALLNVTAVNAQADGFITVFPCGTGIPDASNLNYRAGQTIANAVLGRIGSGGRVCVYTYAASHLIVDINAVVPATSTITAVDPYRLHDSRSGPGPAGAGTITTVQVAGRGGVPPNAVTAVLNVTALEANAPGFVTVYPCDAGLPDASNLNYTTGDTIPNAVIAKLSSTGTVCVYTYASAGLIVDVNGYAT